MITLVFWNPRGINNKDVEFKEFLDGKSAVYAGVSESQTYRSESALSDGRWSWEAGTEGKPTAKGAPPARGMGAFVDVSKAEASVVREHELGVEEPCDVRTHLGHLLQVTM